MFFLKKGKNKGFTLIELLIVIGVLAVLATVVVLILNPANLFEQARDSVRISDIGALDRAIGYLLLVDSSLETNGGSDENCAGGTTKKIWVSVPSDNGESNPTLPDPLQWEYVRKTEAEIRKIDGTGWVPINFNNGTVGSPIAALPVDPINTFDSGHYYTYVCGSYEISAALESSKYSAEAEDDGGDSVGLLEVGSSLTVSPARAPVSTANPAPVVSSISPSSGDNDGAVTATISGTDFSGSAVKLTKSGESDITGVGCTVNPTSIVNCLFNISGAAAGTWNVVVTNSDFQVGTKSGGFTVNSAALPAPTITSITPNSGDNDGSVSATIAGTNFVGSTVKLTKSGESDITGTGCSVTATSISGCSFAISGAAAGTWNVVVTNSDTQLITLSNGFTVNSAVSIYGPTSGLIGYWSFDSGTISGSTVSDLSGGAHHGTILGGISSATGINSSEGLNFRGLSTDYITIPADTAFNFTGDYSISAWIKSSSLGSSQVGIVGKQNTQGWGLLTNSGSVNFGYHSCSNFDGPALSANTWYHIVGIYKASGNDEIYVNADSPTTGNLSGGNCGSDASGLVIGRHRNEGSDAFHFNGIIDEVRIYNRALSSSEVDTLCQQDSSITCGAVPAPTFTSITPNSGDNDGSVSATIAGTNFVGSTVKLTKSGESDITGTGCSVTATSISGCSFAISGAAAGTWNVVVTNSDTQSVTGASVFTVTLPAPTFTSITPNSGDNDGSVSATIAGTNFVGSTVKLTKSGESDITGTGCSVTATSISGCSFAISGAAAGTWNVVVTNSDTQFVNTASAFTVNAAAVAWSLSNISADRKVKSASAQETAPHGVFMKPDGTKMYVVGTVGDDVNEYTLSTAWDVTSAVFTTVSASLASYDGSPKGLFFKPDGTRMYLVGDAGNAVDEYNLSTAWDLSTISYSRTKSVNPQETVPTGIFFKPDGMKMYVTGTAGDDVNEYNLSTAWDVTSAVYSQAFVLDAGDINPEEVFFKSDGTKMYVTGLTSDKVSEYNLSMAWDVASASLSGKYVDMYFSQETQNGGVAIKPDGTRVFVVGRALDRVHQVDLSTAWDLSTYDFGFLSTKRAAGAENYPEGVAFNSDGTKMYISGRTGSPRIQQYDLSDAPWNVSRASRVVQETVISEDTLPRAMAFSSDGTKLFVAGDTNNSVFEYSLPTAWDVTTKSYITSQVVPENSMQALFFKTDGTKMYVLGTGSDRVYEADLSTPWDLSTYSSSGLYKAVGGQEAAPRGMFFESDGLTMYITGSSGDDVNKYVLSTAWDVTSAVYDSVYTVPTKDSTPTGIFFKPDGSKMYTSGLGYDWVMQYSL